MTCITFIRHGQTDANEQGLFAGRSEWELTEKGKAQARATAEELKDCRFDAIYCGNAKRVRDTFEIFKRKSNDSFSNVIFTDDICEIDFGEWEGRSWQDISAEWETEWKEYMDHWDRFCFPGGESIEAYFQNCGRFITSCVKENQQKNIAVFAHKGFILACCCVLHNRPIQKMFEMEIQTGSFFLVNIGE